MNTLLSRRHALLTAMWGATALTCLPGRAWAGQQAGKPAGDITLPDIGGGAFKLSSLNGKVVVVDFFASWCEPCMRELPELEKLHRQLAAAGVAFVGVNLDKERKNAEALVKRFNLTFKVLLDPEGKVADAFDPPKMPTTYVIDKAGVVRFVNAGFDGTADVGRLQKQISELNR